MQKAKHNNPQRIENENTSRSNDFQLIFNGLPDLYLLLDLEFIIVEASDAYIQATLVNRPEIIGRHVFEVFPDNPNDPTATGVKNLRASLNKVLSSQKPDSMAVQKYDIPNSKLVEGEFEERYWSPLNSPIFDENHQIKYILHRVEDVTEFILIKNSSAAQTILMQELQTHYWKMENEIYKRAQEILEVNRNLQNKEEWLNHALQASGIGTWTWDCVKDDIIVDDYLPSLFGITHKNQFPKKLNEFMSLVHPADTEHVQYEIEKSLTTSSPYHTEFRIIWPNNNEHVIAARGFMLRDENNIPAKMAGICLDITDKVKAKRELELITLELDKLNKQLKISNEQLLEFSFIASQDLQELLQMVNYYIQLLEQLSNNKLNQETKDLIHSAIEGIEPIKDLINKLLVHYR